MRSLNIIRVLLGGLLAGLVINVGEFLLNGVILAEPWAAWRAQLGLEALSTAQLMEGIVITFLYGIVLVWMYAAMRPRFGAGPKAAVIAGLTFWAIAYLLFLASLWAGGLVSGEIFVISSLWGLVEAPVAALAGAWIYRERMAG